VHIRRARKTEIKEAIPMNPFTDWPVDSEKIWETPTFEAIPISFEASSYALTDDDVIIR
jgi:hypothetical protein